MRTKNASERSRASQELYLVSTAPRLLLSARHSDRASVTKQGARARASSGWEVPRERCRGIAGSGALGRQGPFVFNAPRPPTCVSKSKNNSQNVKYKNITRRDTSEVFFVTRIVTRLKPHACNRKAASTSTLTKRARPRERPQVTLVTRHVPRLANALFARVVLSLP